MAIVDNTLRTERARTLREALLAMAYKEVKPKIWMKPTGFQCFTVHEDRTEWTNYFISAEKDLEIWDRQPLKENVTSGSYLFQLKNLECFTRTDIYIHGDSNFELFAVDF